MKTTQQNLPTRMKNPGDLRDPSTGKFRQFNTPQEGFAALKQDIQGKITGNTRTKLNGNSSLSDFAHVWAPPGDNNNSVKYAEDLAKQLGVTVHTKIGDLASRLDDFAHAIAKNEGFNFGSETAYAAELPGTQKTPIKISKAEFLQKFGGGNANQQTPGQPIKISRADFMAKFAKKPEAKPQETFGDKVYNTTKDISTGIAQGEMEAVQGAGQAGLHITDALGITKNKKDATFLDDKKALDPRNTAEGAGKFIGEAAPYFTGAGEEEALAAGVKTTARVAKVLGKEATDLVPKVTGWLAQHSITGAVNALIGTAQNAGNLVKGAENAVLAELAQGAIGKVSQYVKNRASRIASRTIDAITPNYTGNAYKEAGQAGHLKAPGIGEQGGVDGTKIPSVTKAVTAISDVAKQLGKKTTDIIKSGSAQVTRNLGRVYKAIGDYSEKVVKPLLEKNPVPFNFQDLRDAFNLIKPTSNFKSGSEEFETFNRITEEALSSIANTIRKTGDINPMTDFNDIWKARKIIDQKGEDELGKAVFGSPQYNGAKQAFQSMRATFAQFVKDSFRYSGQMEKVNKVNEFIQSAQSRGMEITEDMIPGIQRQMGLIVDDTKAPLADAWDKHMDNLHSLFDVVDHLTSKIGSEKGKSAIRLLMKQHPILTKAAETLAAVGGYEYLKKLGVPLP